jgi:hypothetical protein
MPKVPLLPLTGSAMSVRTPPTTVGAPRASGATVSIITASGADTADELP